MENQTIHVLLVEDNPGDAKLIAAVLDEETNKKSAAQQYRIERVDRLQSAIERLGRNAFDVVLLDLSLPDSQGLETVKRMLNATLMPILVLSGLDDENLAVQAVQSGAQDYIVKGHAGGSELARAIRYAIERRRVIEYLQESEERFRLLAENSADLVAQISPDFRYLYVSPSYRTILGYDPLSLTGNDAQKFIHPEDFSVLKANLFQAAAGGNGTFNVEYRILHADGQYRWLDARCTLFYDEREGLVRFQVHSRDVTERKQMEERLKASIHEKDILLKEVHHRVKNNMQVIVSLLNLQFERVKDKQVLTLLKESRDRIFSMALVHEMLYKSDNLSSIRFDEYLTMLAEALFESYGVNERGIGIKLDLKPINLSIEEAIPCGLMVQELISNSLKYAFPSTWKKTKTVSIGLDERDDGIHITVGDDGVGIGIDKAASLKKNKSLGMNLVEILGQQLNARVRMETEEGTHFHIVLGKNR